MRGVDDIFLLPFYFDVMRKIVIALLVLLKLLFLHAQDTTFNYQNDFWPFEIVRKSMLEYKPYSAVRFLKDVDTAYIKNRDFYGQALMTALCFSCEIELKDIICKKFRIPNKKLENEEARSLSIHREKASKIILQEANKYTVMMVNEAHLYPQHRIFFKSLLSDLYNLGYKHLCMEDLVLPDTLGYVKFPERNMGYYIQEPCMGDLVREALKLGFILHSYDVPESKYRDSLAAENIQHICYSYPRDKVLVYCGFSHNMEHRSSTCMASYFKRISGVDPLTIDQTVYCERELSIYYSQLLKYYDIRFPAVLLSGDSIVAMNKKYCDIHVITPPTSYVKGRPRWLVEMDKRRLCKIDSNFTSGIIETYYVNEVRKSKSPIPVDVLVLDFPKKGNQYLALPMTGFFLCKYYDLDCNFLYSLLVE